MFASITVGTLTYSGLHSIDKGLDVSGIYDVTPKAPKINPPKTDITNMEPGKVYNFEDIIKIEHFELHIIINQPQKHHSTNFA